MSDDAYSSGETIPDLNTASGKVALKRSALTVGAVLTGLYGLGALATYSPNDPSLNVATDAAPRNLFGGPGAALADIMMQSLGAASFTAMAALLGAGIVRIGKKRMTSSFDRARLAAGAASVALLAGAASSAPTPGFWDMGEQGFGGLLGDGVSGLLTAIFSAPGLPGAEILAGLLCSVGGIAALGWAFSVTRNDVEIALDASASVAAKAARAAGKAAGKVSRKAQADAAWAAQRRIAQQAPALALAPAAPRPAATEPAPPIPAEQTVFTRQPAATPARRPAPASQPPVQPPTLNVTPAAAPAAARPAGGARPMQPSLFGANPQEFRLPSLDLLMPPRQRAAQTDGATLQAQAKALAEVLADFGIQGEIVSARPGPVVTLFELEPAPGVKSARVISLADDIARSMSATAARVAVIPGRNAIGIELPNPKREMVFLKSLLCSTAFVGAQGALPLALGETIEGEPFAADLTKMPHLLIAGTTGSGKSVGINAMILSLLFRHTPEECRFIMIDPKMLELSIYEGIPHLLSPVVTDPKKAVHALKWTVREMEERYRRMQKIGVRNIQGYNDRVQQALANDERMERTVHSGFDAESGEPLYETHDIPLEKMPFIVVIIDEMADLMITAGREIEAAVQRLAAMARAAGIHVIMATQRPSVDVITGVIKANFPTRLSYTVPSKFDSRTILGEMGAEQLLGQGDALFMAGGGRIRRIHGPYVDDSEVHRIVDMLRAQGAPSYRADITEDPDAPDDGPADLLDAAGVSGDDLFDRAVQIVARDRKASTSYLQRRLNIGYNRAATLIERLEQEGVISTANHAGKRDILVPNSGGD